MAECRYFPECQRCNEVGDSWIPCVGGSDGTRCYSYEPMPDVGALAKLADEIDSMERVTSHNEVRVSDEMLVYITRRIREALGVEL